MVFRKSLLSSSVALALVGTYSPAFAQDDEAVIEEIIVEGGIRGSLKASMDIKRDSMGVVDAISAEDIGKFPDANLAESLQRITGVSISRSRGEGSQVTVRGFGPEYNLVTLNGRQMPTHNGASRSFDFGDLASEGVAGVQVYKTGRADVPSGGVGSTINISTPKPLEADSVGSISVKAVNDTSRRGDDDGHLGQFTPEFSGIYMDTFAEGSIGIAVIASQQERENGVNAASVGGYYTRSGDGRYNPDLKPDEKLANNDAQVNRPTTADANYSLPQSMAYNIAEYRSKRTNGQVVIQMAPSDSVTMTLDYIQSEMDLERSYSDLSAWFSNTATISQSSEWTDGPIAAPIYYQETVDNNDFAMGTGEDGRRNKNKSLGLNFEWLVNDELELNFDWHDSSAETGANSPYGTSALITMASYNKVGQTFVTGYDMPVMLLDLNSGGETNRPLYKNDMVITGSVFSNDASLMNIEQSKFSGTWNFSDESSIDFGVQLSEVDNHAVSNVVQLDNWGQGTTPGAISDIVIRSSVEGQFDQLSGHDYEGIQTEYMTASLADLIAAGEASYVLNADGVPTNATFGGYQAVGDCGTGYCASTEWSGNNVNGFSNIFTLEESIAAYIRYNLNTEVAGMPVNVHMGLRYEETDVTSQAVTSEYENTSWTGGNEAYLVPKVGGGDPTAYVGNYDMILPSFDFDIEIVEDVILRASFSETITRPSYNDIKGGLVTDSTLFYIDSTAVASSGNPNLEPILSRNIDLSAEWYYGEGSYLSVGYFDKDVDKFIGDGREVRSLGPIPNIIGGTLWNQAVAESGLDPLQYTAVANYIQNNYQDSPYVDGDTITGAPGDPDLLWTVSQPVNEKKARVDGVEINLQHFFGESGYGFIANATFADADVSYDNMRFYEGQFVLNGLSDSANLVGVYDKDGLSVRLAYNWRDDFLAGVGQSQPTGNNNPTNVEAYGQLDLGITYEYSDRLTIYASGLNITDETVRVYGKTKDLVLQAVQGGPRYDLAIRYKLF